MPKFKHDCRRCIFLGEHKEYDLYVCKDPDHQIADSWIARYGDDGPEYMSYCPPEGYSGCGTKQGRKRFLENWNDERHVWYHELMKRAIERELYLEPNLPDEPRFGDQK